jgi:hypothetical protein
MPNIYCGAMTADCCLEVLTIREGFFVLEKRSETLDGSVPLRAAQGCKPLLDGNAAGFHLRCGLSAVVRKSRHGAKLFFTDGDDAQAIRGYRSAIAQVVRRGLLTKDGYWSRTLREGPSWQHKDRLFMWTGHLVRPAPGVWMLVSGAFNRRCFVRVREYVIPDNDSFVPLILELDLSSLRDTDTWLDTELACLTPLRPDVAVSVVSLKDRPEAGRAWREFYDPSYVEPRTQGKYIGRYRRITASEPVAESPGRAECHLINVGGSNLHGTAMFDRFATPRGWSRLQPKAATLTFAVVRNIGLVKGRWDGLYVRDLSVDVPDLRQVHREWSAVYGATSINELEFLFEYINMPTPHRGEPLFGIVPRAFAMTPPGWSSLVDSYDLSGMDGMRGVISTDTYVGVVSFWQFYKPTAFTIPFGSKLIRILPVPRRLLRATCSVTSLDAAASAT